MADFHRPDSDNPELALLDMKRAARSTAASLIPILYDKAVNGKTKDALAIFTALADRSGFAPPTPSAPSGPGTQIQIISLQPDQLASMLSGLRTITSSEIINQPSPMEESK